MTVVSATLPWLIAAFGLVIGLVSALEAWRANRRARRQEETWSARLQHRESEAELIITKLGTHLDALQASHGVAEATIRAHEAALAECQCQLSRLEASLAARTAEVDQTREALGKEIPEWEAKFLSAAKARAAETDRLRSRVQELESISQHDQAKLLFMARHKDAQIQALQRQLYVRGQLSPQANHWMFSVLLQESREKNALSSFTHLEIPSRTDTMAFQERG